MSPVRHSLRTTYYIFAQQDDLEAELLDSPEEREPVGSSKNRRDFGTCQVNNLSSLFFMQDPFDSLVLYILYFRMGPQNHSWTFFEFPHVSSSISVLPPLLLIHSFVASHVNDLRF